MIISPEGRIGLSEFRSGYYHLAKKLKVPIGFIAPDYSERILKTINYLKKEDIKYLALSHCTGKNIIKIFKDSGFNILPTNTGNVLEF